MRSARVFGLWSGPTPNARAESEGIESGFWIHVMLVFPEKCLQACRFCTVDGGPFTFRVLFHDMNETTTT